MLTGQLLHLLFDLRLGADYTTCEAAYAKSAAKYVTGATVYAKCTAGYATSVAGYATSAAEYVTCATGFAISTAGYATSAAGYGQVQQAMLQVQ